MLLKGWFLFISNTVAADRVPVGEMHFLIHNFKKEI